MKKQEIKTKGKISTTHKSTIKKEKVKKEKLQSAIKVTNSSKLATFIAGFFDQSLTRIETPYSIDIRHFTKRFKKFIAVDNISIQVRKGAIHGFIGPNGSGKTTTIKCLVGAMFPTKGELYLSGYSASTVQAKAKIGYIPENARFPKRISSYDYLVSMATLSNVAIKDAKALAKKILEDLNLWKFRKKNPNTFSSGMKKKMQLAQALMNDPEILILDEPAANLDPTARAQLISSLKELAVLGKTIFISSHILSEMQNFVTEVTILNHGKVIYSGKIQDEEEREVQINTNNNPKLLKWLRKEQFKVKMRDHEIVVALEDISDKNKVLRHLAAEKIELLTWMPAIQNIEKLYQDLIFEENNK